MGRLEPGSACARPRHLLKVRAMGSLERPLVVVSDVHLSHGTSRDTAFALGRLVERHPGHEIVLNGDVWNLSLDPPGRDPTESALAMLRPHGALCHTLRAHLAAGGRIVVVPGNHDAGVGKRSFRAALLAELELGGDAPLEVAAWLVRRGPVHVEHGHVYDPDNAPTHPLVPPAPGTEPLGVALTRRFLAPNDAFDFAHATEITPLEALARAFRVFGARTPLLLARYFVEAGRFSLEARFRPELLAEKRAGDALFAIAAREAGVEASLLRALDEDRPRPTHESFEQAFFRLYFDRVAGVAGIVAGGALVAALRGFWGVGVGVGSALYLYESVRRGANRYEGLPVKRLRAAAARVAELTGAGLVVFGHTHVADSAPAYLNPGSFAYRSGPGRPYAYIDESARAEPREL